MKKLFMLALLVLAALGCAVKAQVTSEPSPLFDDSQGVVIYFHADQGNKGLMGEPASAQLYAHTGVITTTSGSDADWQYAPAWGDNDAKYKLEYVSPNLWKLNIGDIYKYYGITDPEVIVTRLAFVFRNATGSKEAKATGNKDIFLEVKNKSIILSLTSTIDGSVVLPGKETAEYTLTSNNPASLELFVDGHSIGSADNATSLKASYTFSEQGKSYTVRGVAKAGDQQKAIEQIVSYPVPGVQADYPGGVPAMGARRQADGSVIFCIGAPEKSSVLLLGSWNDFLAADGASMNYQDYQGNRYFWTSISGLDNTSQYLYYFIVDGTKKVGDPYAKLVLDPWNDKYIPEDVYPDLPAYPSDKVKDVPLAIFQGNINDYDWKVKNFKGVDPASLVIYELLLRDFTGTEGKAEGNGTVRKALAKLPYLKRLGVNAIELLPINEFNGNISWGYNPNFYFAPDKAYGTPDDYKEFIDECHRQGIAVILDIVFNQTDWLHPWYQMYPVGSNPFFNADAPHAYSVLNDWNQGNPLVQQQFKDVLRYWIEEYNIDGYRFDLVKGLGDNDSYSNNGDAATNAYNASRVARMKEFQDAIKEVKPDAYFINENLAGSREENEMAAFGQLNWANLNYQAQNFAAGTQSNSALNRFYAPLDSRTWGSTVSYLESHDEQRLAYVQNSRGVAGIKGNLGNSMLRLGSAAAQMLMAPGAHMIWQFSELGNDDNTKNSNGGNNTDPKTVRWSYYEVPERQGLYDTYRDLIAIRTLNPDLFTQQATATLQCGDNNWAAGRTIILRNGDKEIYTVINPTTKQTVVNVDFTEKNTSAYQILAKSYQTNPSFNPSTGIVALPANSFAVIGSASLLDVEATTIARPSDAICAWAENGRIVMQEEGEADIYDLQGQLIYSGDATTSLQVAPGVYIVRAGLRAAKLLVP